MLYPYRLITGALLLAFVNGGAICIGLNTIAYAHEEHRFAAGEPGDPKKAARTINVAMREDGKKMAFEPARINENSEYSAWGRGNTAATASRARSKPVPSVSQAAVTVRGISSRRWRR